MCDFAGWASCGVGSSVTWEDHTVSHRHLAVPEPLADATPEQLEMLDRFRVMSFEMTSLHHAILVERTPDRVVVDVTSQPWGPGLDQKFTRREVLPAVPPPEPATREISHVEDEDGGSAVVVKQSWDDLFRGVPATEGDERIDVAGRAMACRWNERAIDGPTGRFQVKFWRCADIPGGIARSSVRMEGPMEQQTVDTKIIALERKAP